MPSSTLRLATPADEAFLRRLLRDNPMPGSISLTYEREPDYFFHHAACAGSLPCLVGSGWSAPPPNIYPSCAPVCSVTGPGSSLLPAGRQVFCLTLS